VALAAHEQAAKGARSRAGRDRCWSTVRASPPGQADRPVVSLTPAKENGRTPNGDPAVQEKIDSW